MESLWSDTLFSSTSGEGKVFLWESDSLDVLATDCGSPWLKGSWLQAKPGIGSGLGSPLSRKGYQVHGVDQGADPQLVQVISLLTADLTLIWRRFSTVSWGRGLVQYSRSFDDYKTASTKARKFKIFLRSIMTPGRVDTVLSDSMLEKKQGIIIAMCSIASSLAGGEAVMPILRPKMF